MWQNGLTLPEGYPSFKPVKGAEFTYPTLRRGENCQRFKKILRPETTSPYSTDGNKIVRFKLPNDGNYQFKRGFLKFRLDITHPVGAIAPVGAYQALPFGVWNVFDRVRELNSTQLITETNGYNRVYSMRYAIRQDPDVQAAQQGQFMGCTNLPARKTLGLLSSYYECPLQLGFFSAGIMPFHAMGDQFLELYLAEPNTYLETNWPASIVSLSNIEFHVEKISDLALERELFDEVMKGQFRIHFRKWDIFQNIVTGPSQNLVISHKANIFNNVMSMYFNTNDTNNTLLFDKFYTWLKYQTTDFQFRLANELIPEIPVECRGIALEAYTDLIRWTNSWNLEGIGQDACNIDNDAFNNNQFVIVGDFESNPDSGFANNVSTRKANPDLQLLLNLAVSPPDGTVLLHFLESTVVVIVGIARGQFTVIT